MSGTEIRCNQYGQTRHIRRDCQENQRPVSTRGPGAPRGREGAMGTRPQSSRGSVRRMRGYGRVNAIIERQDEHSKTIIICMILVNGRWSELFAHESAWIMDKSEDTLFVTMSNGVRLTTVGVCRELWYLSVN